ncbi:hypothetical protein IP91_02589 [Pseudoduganella lurida]|uniref:Uncharacterized protein n=1 Tax=Pseudoduganella lurida TaxID=1036180 RepID=A0A562R7Y7_9BURK|nr:hypothetical protein IP91_02589 [Pseudoduganella lurida]
MPAATRARPRVGRIDRRQRSSPRDHPGRAERQHDAEALTPAEITANEPMRPAAATNGDRIDLDYVYKLWLHLVHDPVIARLAGLLDTEHGAIELVSRVNASKPHRCQLLVDAPLHWLKRRDASLGGVGRLNPSHHLTYRRPTQSLHTHCSHTFSCHVRPERPRIFGPSLKHANEATRANDKECTIINISFVSTFLAPYKSPQNPRHLWVILMR